MICDPICLFTILQYAYILSYQYLFSILAFRIHRLMIQLCISCCVLFVQRSPSSVNNDFNWNFHWLNEILHTLVWVCFCLSFVFPISWCILLSIYLFTLSIVWRLSLCKFYTSPCLLFWKLWICSLYSIPLALVLVLMRLIIMRLFITSSFLLFQHVIVTTTPAVVFSIKIFTNKLATAVIVWTAVATGMDLTARDAGKTTICVKTDTV